MKQTMVKIFLACAFGALIGGFVSLQIGKTWYAALIGFLVGGFMGYISYEFKTVVKTVKEVATQMPDWQEVVEAWPNIKKFGVLCFWSALAALNTIPLFVMFICMFRSESDPGSPVLFWTIQVVLLLMLMLLMHTFASTSSKWNEDGTRILDKGRTLKRLKNMNFLRVWFYLIPKGIFWCICQIPRAIFRVFSFCWQVLKKTFIIIHSEIRLLCLLDAGLGAVICHQIWSPSLVALIVGALAGGLLGVANFYIVSVKLLKLVPIKAR